MISARHCFAVAVLAAVVSSSAFAREAVVRYHSQPLLSEKDAGAVCKTYNYYSDRLERILRFVCTRKFLYVCNGAVAVPSSDPEAAGKCFVERARNYDYDN